MSGYLRFERTGNVKIDGIIAVLESAGDAYHDTSYWIDHDPDDGMSHIERIQEALNFAAKE